MIHHESHHSTFYKFSKEIASFRHTKEKDKEHSEKLSGTLQIYNKDLNIYKKIKKELSDEYLNDGWIIKSNPSITQKRCYINGNIYMTAH